MIKINASYSKKVPAEQDFSSKSFMCSIEAEVNSGASASEIQRTIAETFDLVKSSVEGELTGRKDKGSSSREKRPKDRQPRDAGRRPEQRATNKQVQYILSLGQEQNLGLPELNRMVADQFDAGNVYDLSKRDASAFVDVLKAAA